MDQTYASEGLQQPSHINRDFKTRQMEENGCKRTVYSFHRWWK
jgi:hypothetical protein